MFFLISQVKQFIINRHYPIYICGCSLIWLFVHLYNLWNVHYGIIDIISHVEVFKVCMHNCRKVQIFMHHLDLYSSYICIVIYLFLRWGSKLENKLWFPKFQAHCLVLLVFILTGVEGQFLSRIHKFILYSETQFKKNYKLDIWKRTLIKIREHLQMPPSYWC